MQTKVNLFVLTRKTNKRHENDNTPEKKKILFHYHQEYMFERLEWGYTIKLKLQESVAR